MAPLPTIGNCVRVAINWNASGALRPINVLHLITASDDEEEIAGALGDAFQAGGAPVWQALSNAFTIDSYTVTLLDGSSAGQVINEPTTIGGQATGDIIPAAAAVLSFHTPQRGPRGRGRLYIGPIGEGVQAGGVLTGTNALDMVGAWQDVATDLAASSIAASLGVASYVHAEVNGVTSISMRPQIGTQRRRQNQLL